MPVTSNRSRPHQAKGWLSKALGVVASLPTRHRPAAFVAVLLAGIAVTFAATLLSKEGLEFLYGAPVIAFGIFFIATLSLLFYLKADGSRGLIGLFYFLPFLYAVVVLALALINLASGSGPITLTQPSDGAIVHSPLSVHWQPPVPALVTVSKDGGVVASSKDFVQPPYRVALAAGRSASVSVRSRLGQTTSASFTVEEDPRKVALESVYRPDTDEDDTRIELGLIMPRGFAIDAFLVVSSNDRQEIGIFGKAERCDSRVKSPGGVGDLCYFFLPVVHAGPGVTTAEVNGVIYDRSGEVHQISHVRSVRFGNILVSLDLAVDFDGNARLIEVPG